MGNLRDWTTWMMIALTILSFYLPAFAIFQLRNPTANNMTFYSEFVHVISFEKMERYQ